MGKWFSEPVYSLKPSSERVLEFKGLNRKTVIDDGEMRDMWNLSSDEYPCLTQRKGRALADKDRLYLGPIQMLVKMDKLAVMDVPEAASPRFYYNKELIREFSEPQKMVGIGNHIVFFPSKMMFDARAYNEQGQRGLKSIEVKVTVYDKVNVDSTNNGANDGTLLKFPTTVDLSGIAPDDVITIKGVLGYDGGTTDYTGDNYLACLVKAVGDHELLVEYDLFLEMLSAGATAGVISQCIVERSCPNLTHVMEYGNRIWGTCDDDNSIRCCKLGDPTNWEYFQGESIDSYAATQGTEGKWTGCAPYSTHLLFFKESHIHKLYGSYPSQFQIVSQEANGVEYGSERSIAIIEDLVFYKSRIGLLTYGGDRPRLISAAFDNHSYKNAVCGANRRKYYCSMDNEVGEREFLVYDAATNMWHREDDLNATCFCFYDEQLLAADSDGNVWIIDGGGEDDIEWSAEFGPFHEYIEEKKVVSKLKMRYELQPGAHLDVYIKTDRRDMEMIEQYTDDYESAGMIRIVPTRCDKYWIRLEGKGRCRIDSLVRQYRTASGRY